MNECLDGWMERERMERWRDESVCKRDGCRGRGRKAMSRECREREEKRMQSRREIRIGRGGRLKGREGENYSQKRCNQQLPCSKVWIRLNFFKATIIFIPTP